ncbi:dephospho-CoA kinase [Aliicoccus persicus]|uniref:Dephospho-CoA kinase n=1 Tax=Aliicoccus persicus TaxID=930138 RepID=A0A662Z3M4_9STAP|nr:dephospho-CoA kinase [Aliicoccus persicus]SEV86845.1 dephospho-CoA kinase [Aliicoccus persicus]
MGKIIGLTGGIASGKSTTSNYLKEKGYIVLDADQYAKKILEPGQNAYHNIIDYFGKKILNSDKTINRKALGHIVFNDSSELQKLNQFTHPEVKRLMQEDQDRYIKDNHVFLDIPLLFENKRDKACDLVITVYVSYEAQIERLMNRNGFTEDEAKSRINSQMSLEEKKKMSDVVFDNNGTKEELFKQVDQFISKLENNLI